MSEHYLNPPNLTKASHYYDVISPWNKGFGTLFFVPLSSQDLKIKKEE